MQSRILGRTGLEVSPIAIGGAPLGYVQKATGWDPTSDQGRRTVQRTLNAALDRGVNYVDTAPLYGDGRSETLVGEVMRTRRAECVLASKVWHELDAAGVTASVERSLVRLQTDHIDVLQVHGRTYTQSELDHIVHGGPLDALVRLRERGVIGHIGVTTEEPWTVIPLLDVPEFEVYQIAYNLIYQAAATHFLVKAADRGVGVVTMRTMTSGVLQRQMGALAPEWQEAHDVYEVALKFVLSDSRIASGIVGMRWPEEVERNVALLTDWAPTVDIATMPRLTFEVYRAEDADAGV